MLGNFLDEGAIVEAVDLLELRRILGDLEDDPRRFGHSGSPAGQRQHLRTRFEAVRQVARSLRPVRSIIPRSRLDWTGPAGCRRIPLDHLAVRVQADPSRESFETSVAWGATLPRTSDRRGHQLTVTHRHALRWSECLHGDGRPQPIRRVSSSGPRKRRGWLFFTLTIWCSGVYRPNFAAVAVAT